MRGARNAAEPTVDELLATLARTNLPTLVCEGRDDIIVYRRIEDALQELSISVLPVGGRNNVLRLFERRAEIAGNVRVAFVSDRDTWVHTGLPEEYQAPELIFTDGYSIENDVFCDGELERLLNGAEKTAFSEELRLFLDWYAIALARHLQDGSVPISLHPDHVLDRKHYSALCSLTDGEDYPHQLRANLGAAYKRLMRGKSLFALLIRSTNARPGSPRHTDKGLLEVVAARPGALLNRLTDGVKQRFV